MILTTVPVPALAPGQSTTISTEVVIPGSAMTTEHYTISVAIAEDPIYPDAHPGNNLKSKPIGIDPSFTTAARRWNNSEAAACALTSSNQTYCWGENQFWEFGAAGTQQNSPFQSTPLQLNFVEMARGPASQFFCGIKADRSAACWGRNGFGMLGRGVQGGLQNPPAPVNGGISWQEITTGRLSACGTSTTGVGYCWGSNQHGEIGNASVPLPVPPTGNTPATMTFAPLMLDGGHTWRSVVAGWLHACGITTTGAAYCWGDNVRGQLGLGAPDTLSHNVPLPVTGGHTFIQLSLGATHSCGITTAHELYCWGENFNGQVGDGTFGPTADVATPTRIGAPMRFSYVAAGSDFGVGGNVPVPGGGQAANGHTCALTEGGQAWCWGWNGAGQLGNGTTVDSPVPVPVAGSLRFTSLSLGGTTSCGQRGNRIWCWGGNEFGQLGIGTVINVSTPTLIGSPFDVP
jgi:alpha-tubulin suppressor-like RCC1 family protein